MTDVAFDAHTDQHHGGDDHAHTPTGWRRFVYSTNHKDIGTMYLIFAICAGLIGGFFSMMMRVVAVELGRRGCDVGHSY